MIDRLWDLWLDVQDISQELAVRSPQYVPFINTYTILGFVLGLLFATLWWDWFSEAHSAPVV